MSLAFVNTSTGVASATLPAGWAPGDLAVCFAFRDGSTTVPSLPAGWTNIISGGASSCSERVGWRILVAGDTTTGTWANATSVVCLVYCGQDATPIGASAQGGSAATSVTYPALTLQHTDGTSWIAGFAGHRSINTALETPPGGTVLRASVLDATDEAAGFDTDGGVATGPARVVPVGGTASGWRAVAVELRGGPSDHPLTDALTGQADAAERSRIKSQALAQMAGWVGGSASQGAWTVTLLTAPTFVGGLLSFDLRVDHNAVDVTPADLNPVRVYNPPVLVPDPAGSVIRRNVEPITGSVTVNRYREDLRAALTEVVRGLIAGRV